MGTNSNDHLGLVMAKLIDILRVRISDLRIKEVEAKNSEEKKQIIKVRKSNEDMLLSIMRSRTYGKN